LWLALVCAMSLDLDQLPEDPAILRAALCDLAASLERQTAELEAARRGLEGRDAEIERLRFLIHQLQRHRFGRRSEQLDPDQLQLALEELEAAVAEAEAAQAAHRSTDNEDRQRTARPRRNRGSLPANLPRFEVLVDIVDKTCPCCGGAMHVIAEDVAEMLDIVPAQLRVKVIRRPRYGCRGCSDAVVQAPAAPRPIEGGLPTEAMLAHVLVAKYADFLPLYRQARIFARQGIALDRSTLADWVGHAGHWLAPLHERLLASVLAAPRVFADDTPLPVLDPGRGRTKIGRLWAYATDDRPWAGPAPPAVAFVYAEDRKGARPAAHLAGFSGPLQVDGYSGFKNLPAGIELAFCWAHCRRRFYEAHQATASPIAAEALDRIATLYQVETRIRGRPADERRDARQEHSRPIVEALAIWLALQLERVSKKSGLAEAIRYAQRHWIGLLRYLDDGRLEIDTNTVERSIRPIALGRKNSLFAGSDGGARHWAIVASLIQTARLNDVEPCAYLTSILTELVARPPDDRLDALLPWNWAAAR
jgi:transposase